MTLAILYWLAVIQNITTIPVCPPFSTFQTVLIVIMFSLTLYSFINSADGKKNKAKCHSEHVILYRIESVAVILAWFSFSSGYDWWSNADSTHFPHYAQPNQSRADISHQSGAHFCIQRTLPAFNAHRLTVSIRLGWVLPLKSITIIAFIQPVHVSRYFIHLFFYVFDWLIWIINMTSWVRKHYFQC